MGKSDFKPSLADQLKSALGIKELSGPDAGVDEEAREKPEQQTVPKNRQNLIVAIDRKGRAGKTVTVVRNFDGDEEELEALGRMLKTKCGTGGSVKNGEILIQGDKRDLLVSILTGEGYKAKRGN